jgi:hypothetical protein
MQTGQRGTQRVSPRDVTGTRARELLRQKAERKKAADTDVEAVRQESFQRGFDAAWETAYLAGWTALAEILTDAGIDVDSVLGLDDDQGDEPGEGE